MKSNNNFALVLSGGAGLGFAHLGVLKFLEEINLKPDVVCGTSIGALIGGLYAMGKSADEIMELAKNFNQFKIFDFKLFPLMSQSLLRSEKINTFLKELFGQIKIEDLKVKFGCVAIDVAKKESVEFTSGELWKAVRASISVPAIFEPFEIDGCKYVDGGIMDNIPTGLSYKLGAEKNIAVNIIDYDIIINKPKNLLHCLINSFNYSQKELVRLKTRTDLFIQLHLEDVSMLSFSFENAEKCFSQGYNQVKTTYLNELTKFKSEII